MIVRRFVTVRCLVNHRWNEAALGAMDGDLGVKCYGWLHLSCYVRL